MSRRVHLSLLASLVVACAPSTTPTDAGSSPTDAGPSITCGPGTVLVGSNCEPIDAGSGTDAGQDAGPTTITQIPITLDLALAIGTPDGGVVDGGPTQVATLTITARNGTAPLVTDLWLYTLDGTGNQTEIDGFTSTAARKSPRLMLPATIAGTPSGLSPADDGRMNGVMTQTTRGVLDQGAFVSTVNGTVAVTLPTVPTQAILVVAGIEDQRYVGAAVINPDGSPGTVPSGVGMPQTHTLRSFTRDVKPILQANCAACHNDNGSGAVENSEFYLVNGTAEELVYDNFALKEQTQDCQEANPDGGLPLAECIQAIKQAQYLVEPGAPAVSDLLQRARPDEDAGTSTLGLAWYGSHGNRYNATYGDRRMPSTTTSTNPSDWNNATAYFDSNPDQYQIIWDWVAQGANAN